MIGNPCVPGDLAILIAVNSPELESNIGGMCKVLAHASTLEKLIYGELVWYVRILQPAQGGAFLTETAVPLAAGETVSCPDRCLKPIRPPAQSLSIPAPSSEEPVTT